MHIFSSHLIHCPPSPQGEGVVLWGIPLRVEDCRWQSFCDLTESPDKNRPCGINIYRNIILTAVTIITEPNTILSHRTEIFDNSFAPSAPPISPPNVTGSHSEKSNQPPRMYKTELTADIKKITAIAVACDFFSSIY